jgi:glycosyltransferase involved in cell wall biosynthesis
MRIAIVGSRGYPSYYGGFETFVRRLAPALRDRGHDVTVYGRGGGLRFRTRVTDGIRCVDTPGIETKSLSTLSHGMFASMHASHGDYDCALVVNVAHGFFLEQFRAAGIPTVVNVDGIEWMRAKWGTFAKGTFRMGARLTASHGSLLVADSEAVADIWKEQFGIRPQHVAYGADVVPDSAQDRVRELGLDPGSYLLVVARLVPENNVELFLDAAERLPDRPPVVVVGSANYRCDITQRLQELSDGSDNVHWLGHVDDQALLGQLWSNCRLYVHGHSAGGTNPALLQALGFGAPTIALNTVFNREVLGSFPNAMFPADATQLSEIIGRELRQPGSHATAVHEGQELIQRSYSWKDICLSYEQLLIEAAETAVAPAPLRGAVPAAAVEGG